ncbi:MAG: 2-amino-4-oxopentanoate thiolase subunit OrtA [Defluviitaleaceae bacterium]|nr:2-amino-4-oxopentanoate thiolase subunit OrtA [Defluviitaleaceae bacterium]
MTIAKGTWVQIRSTVLEAGERAPQVPEDTKAVPLLLWVKGYTTMDHTDLAIGDVVEVETVTGRKAAGILEEIEPGYHHGWGSYVPELDAIRKQVREMLEEVV